MMQKKVQIISDGSLDLSQELTKEKDIEVVPFYVSFDSETYQKEMVEVGVREFYQEMVDHPTVFPKTSMPSVHDYYEVFEKHAKEKMPVICICITRKFSGSLQSATTAKDMILEEYPDAQITVIDSTVNTVLQGLYVLEACRLRDMGLEYQQIVDALLPIRETGRIFFTIGSIDYLKHGGRIGKLAGIAASALKIKPLITLKEGEIFNSGITRNRLKSMKKVVDMTREYLPDRCNHWSAHRTISDRDRNYKACIDRVTDMYPFYWTSSERGTYQLSGRFLVPASGTNDNILRIIP